MLSSEAQEQFAAYLRESLSRYLEDTGGIKSVKNFLLDNFKIGAPAPKDVVYRQKQMLRIAEKYLTEKPWITYFAAVKHIIYLKSQGIDASSFDDFRDKEYADEVEHFAETIETSAESLLDTETQEYLQELITLQRVEPMLDQAINGLLKIRAIPHAEMHTRVLHWNDKRPVEELNSDVLVAYMYAEPAAKALNQDPHQWMLTPHESIAYLQELKQRRTVLEDTYFPC